MTPVHQLNDLQIEILRVLWRRGEASVGDVQEALRSLRDPATTTVATVLHRMEKKGLVTHRTAGRQFVYRPSVTEQEVRRSIVSEVTDQLFQGDVAAVVNHLLSGREVSSGDLARVKAMIEARQREGGPSHGD